MWPKKKKKKSPQHSKPQSGRISQIQSFFLTSRGFMLHNRIPNPCGPIVRRKKMSDFENQWWYMSRKATGLYGMEAPHLKGSCSDSVIPELSSKAVVVWKVPNCKWRRFVFLKASTRRAGDCWDSLQGWRPWGTPSTLLTMALPGIILESSL